MEHSAHREAATSFEQALDAVQHLPESRARTEQAIDLHLSVSGATGSMGQRAKGTEHAREARLLAETLGDERRLGRALSRLGMDAWMAGDPERALELAQRTLVLATAHDDVTLQAWAALRLGIVWQTIGDYRRATEYLGRVAGALQGDRRYERLETGVLTSVFAQDRLAWCLADVGEFAEAMARADEAGRIAHEIDHPSSLVVGYRSLGLVALCRGDLMQAIPPLERSVELCRTIPVPALSDVSTAYLGYAYALSGRLREGVALLEGALSDPVYDGHREPFDVPRPPRGSAPPGRSPGRCARGRLARPRPRAPAEGARNEAWVLRLLGEIAAQANPLQPAAAQYGQALARADELGMRPLAAHCHLGLGKVSRRTGELEEACEHLTTATAMYREMGITFWLENAEMALKEAG